MLDPVFSAMLNDPVLPFFPKSTPVASLVTDVSVENSESTGPADVEMEVEADASLGPLESPELQVETPAHEPSDDTATPSLPSNKDLDDRIRDLLKGLARDRFNAERCTCFVFAAARVSVHACCD